MLTMVSHGILVADADMAGLLELFQHASGFGVRGVLPWTINFPAFHYCAYMRKILLLGVVFVIGGLLAIAGCRTSRSGYESAPYTVVRSDGDFELRDYPVLKVVETAMRDGGSGGSFNRLFRYITGGNDAGKKIAMTTPVFMAGGESTMAFVMPADLGKVPPPMDESVTIREMPAGRFAVLRFSGVRSPQQEAEHLELLKTWVASQHLKVSTAPVYGYFDPPWTPSFLRRNEVMLRFDQ